MTVKWIRMRETLSGGRCDGRPWPPAGGDVDVPDWEAEHAIRAGYAHEVDPPEPEKKPDPETEQAKAPAPAAQPRLTGWESGQYVQPPPQPEAPATPADVSRETAPEQADHDVPEPPRPADQKQDWVDYAVARGLAADKAAAMSKADLMSRYGGRL